MILFRLQPSDSKQFWALEVPDTSGEWRLLRHFSNQPEALRVLTALSAIGELAEACDD